MAICVISMCVKINAQTNGVFWFTTPSDCESTISGLVVASDAEFLTLCPGGVMDIPSILVHNGKTYTMTNIQSGFCQNQSWLTEVIIPASIVHIGDASFSGCANLKSITIKGDLDELGNNLFKNCSSLESIVIEGNIPSQTSFLANITAANPSLKIYVSSDPTDTKWKEYVTKNDVVVGYPEESVTPNAEGIPTYSYNQKNQSVSFKRSFSSTEKWQALYIPFSLSYNEWKDEFEIAKLISIHRYYDDDGVETGWLLEVVPLESGSTTPLTPYVIRGKHTGECSIDVNNKTVYRAEKKSLTCESIETLYTFEGTIAQEQNLNQPGWYVISDGSLKKVGSATSKLKAYRWILKCTAKDGQLYDDGISSTSEIRIRVKGDVFGESGNEEITAIEYTEDNTHTVVPTAYYSVNGTVSKSAKKGFNIVRMSDGSVRKVVVR